jgi:hypothetical protein
LLSDLFHPARAGVFFDRLHTDLKELNVFLEQRIEPSFAEELAFIR